MDSSDDDDNDFNDEFFEDLRLHNTNDSKLRKPQILGELPDVAQKYAACELSPALDESPEISQPVNSKHQTFKEFLHDH